MEERILDNKVELSLREVLRIAKKEFHDSIVDLVKRKRLLTETEPEKPVEVRVGSGQGRLCGRDHTTICFGGRTCVWKI